MKYLTIQEIQCVGPGSCAQRIDPLTEALLDLEVVDDAMTDPDLAADVSTGHLDIQMIIDAAEPAEATIKAIALLRAEVFPAVGDAIPGECRPRIIDLVDVSAKPRDRSE